MICFRAAMIRAAVMGWSAISCIGATADDSAQWRLALDTSGLRQSSLRALEPVRLAGAAPAGSRIELQDGRQEVYADRPVEGEFRIELPAGGALGRQQARLVGKDGRLLATVPFRVDATTTLRTSDGEYDRLWTHLESLIRDARRVTVLRGRPVPYYASWVRDDVHISKATKYWEPEIGALTEHFLDVQPPDGIIFDYFCPTWEFPERPRVFEPRYIYHDEADGMRYDRLPVEADMEYMVVEGVYTAWQARGDDVWLARQLPRLEKALHYTMTDPLRWSAEHGLVKRAYTIDTWDFKFFGFDRKHLKTAEDVYEAVFNLRPDTPMCIMHGDNSGMYQACRQMAEMFTAIGDEAKASRYSELARRFRENTNKHCWNGRHYDHWVPITPLEIDQGGVDGSNVLSLSNPYDINRGLPDHEQSVKIIREYQRLREELKSTHFAEWVSVYPYWPKGFSGHEGGTYVNGGIITIVAGELAKAALHHGCEAYGVEILDRLTAMLDKSLAEWKAGATKGRRFSFGTVFTPSGAPSEGIPHAWAHAAVLSAVMEGLAGVRDESTAFSRCEIAPRWAAAAVREAEVTARYGASGGYVAYRFCHDPTAKRIDISMAGSGNQCRFHVLLPRGSRAVSAKWTDASPAFKTVLIEGSLYVDFEIGPPLWGTASVVYETSRTGS